MWNIFKNVKFFVKIVIYWQKKAHPKYEIKSSDVYCLKVSKDFIQEQNWFWSKKKKVWEPDIVIFQTPLKHPQVPPWGHKSV